MLERVSFRNAKVVAGLGAFVGRETTLKDRSCLLIVADDPAVIGVGVRESEDDPAAAAMLAYMDKKKVSAFIPPLIGTVRTRVVVADGFHSTTETRSNAQRIVTQPETHCPILKFRVQW